MMMMTGHRFGHSPNRSNEPGSRTYLARGFPHQPQRTHQERHHSWARRTGTLWVEERSQQSSLSLSSEVGGGALRPKADLLREVPSPPSRGKGPRRSPPADPRAPSPGTSPWGCFHPPKTSPGGAPRAGVKQPSSYLGRVTSGTHFESPKSRLPTNIGQRCCLSLAERSCS